MTKFEAEFLHSYVLDRRGGAVTIASTEVDCWTEDHGILWVHIDVNNKWSRRWLVETSGLDSSVVDALLAGETRPRSFSIGEGLLIVLRGLNTNPGADPEDMVSIRVWIERNRIISTRRRRLLSVLDLTASLDEGRGPTSPGSFVATLVGGLADRIGDFVESIEERVGVAEDGMTTESSASFRQTIAILRRQIASVRRFLGPQRDALDRLYRAPGTLFSGEEIHDIRDEADRITRYLEDLDLARERTIVIREEYLGQLAQEQNERMYVLSIVAAIFLPLTFVTGLLGMNVGGLPGLESPRGFLGSVVIMIISATALLAYFRWRKWL